MPTRSLSILCLLQVVALVGSWLLTRSFAKAHEADLPGLYPATVWFDWMKFSKWAIWLLIFIPAVLVFVGSRLSATHRGMTVIPTWWFWVSAVITAGVLYYSVLMVLVALQGPPRSGTLIKL